MSTKAIDRPLLYYRLGVAADKEPLLRAADYIDGLIIGGHVFAWGQPWVSVFLQEIKKPFLVDPVTYVFSKDPSILMREGNLRKSYEALVDWFDWKLSNIAGKRPLRPDDFGNGDDEEAIEEFVLKVIEFQGKIPSISDNLQHSLDKYAKISGESPSDATLSPDSYLSPYFHATDIEDPWYNITLQCALKAKEVAKDRPAVPVLCISESFASDPLGREQICKDLSVHDNCVLWISGLNEYALSSGSLKAQRQLCEDLSNVGVATTNLYGGYYSMILHKSGIGTTCSGSGFGESKSADQIATGGGFPNRYYIPSVKQTIVEANARAFLLRNPTFLCDCEVCRELYSEIGLDSNSPDFADQLDMFFQNMRGATTRIHFFHCRAEESSVIGESELDHITSELRESKSKLDEAESGNYGISTNHLEQWASSI